MEQTQLCCWEGNGEERRGEAGAERQEPSLQETPRRLLPKRTKPQRRQISQPNPRQEGHTPHGVVRMLKGPGPPSLGCSQPDTCDTCPF